MVKLIHMLVIFCFLSPSISNATPTDSTVKVAYIKDGFLWINDKGLDKKVTDQKSNYPYPPQWSFDGKMLLYQKEVRATINESQGTENELWVYDLQTKKHRKIFYDGHDPKWSPTENIVAFQSGGVLNISDLTSFYNIALGVDAYEWQPNGKGFIASSSASLRPDGWTHPILYTISLKGGYQNISDLTKHVKKFLVIPKELKKNDVKIPSINAQSFAYSPNNKWISFIVSPTASFSMDSDMLCVISAEGKEFTVLDEVILEFQSKWSFKDSLLGYIAGGGRIVFGFKDKDLKVTELPAYHTLTLTPKNYADMGFTWVNDRSLIVSRVKETDWSNDPKKRPKPTLYFVTLDSQKQIQITMPSKDQGDYNPQFLPLINKITWVRQIDIASTKGDLWVAEPNGENAQIWIQDIGPYSFYPSK
ncbi:TolB domain-containing protein [Paenisporosarcina sp. FSL H8-0542]|uniref:TolB family protein n=1 Tax=Paenisporosarcina sp. FSL H8-0542 TaxID=2921401 RepID=UPI00315AB0D1